MQVEKLASAIYNDVVSGLAGITSTPTISMEQLQDDVIDERLQIIKEYSLKNLIPKKDLLYSINCIETDCKSLDKCCSSSNYSKPELHFVQSSATVIFCSGIPARSSILRLTSHRFSIYFPFGIAFIKSIGARSLSAANCCWTGSSTS